MGKKNLFRRFLWTCFLILIIPLFGFGLFTTRYVFVLLENQAMEGRHQDLLHGVQLLERRFGELEEIAMQISSDRRFREMKYPDNPYKAFLTLKDLGQYRLPNSFIDNLILYNAADQFFYASRETYRFETFMQLAFPFEHRTAASLQTVLENNRVPMVWGEETAESDDLLFFIPFPYPGGFPSGQLMFFLKKGNILEYFPPVRNEMLYVLDEQAQVTVSRGTEALRRRFADGLSLATGTEILVEDTGYRAVVQESVKLGWTFCCMIPVSDIRDELVPLYRVFLYVVLIVLVLGLFAIYVVSRLNYAPILRFRQFFEDATGRRLADRDDLEAIRTAFQDFWADRRELQRRIERNRPAVMRLVLIDLLQGRAADEDRFFAILRETGVDWNKRYFRTFQVLFEQEKASRKSSCILDCLPGKWECLWTVNLADDRVIVVANGSDPDDAWFADLSTRISTACAGSATIGVSGLKEDPFDTHEAFLESSMALDYRMVEGKGKTLFYDVIRSRDASAFIYPHRSLEQLRLSLLKGDRREEKAILVDLIGRMKQEVPPLFQLRRIYFQLVNLYLRFSDVDSMETGGPADIFQLQEVDTFDDLMEMIDSFTRLPQMRRSGTTESKTISEVLQWLDENFADPNLCRNMIADKFGISPPYLSTLFKRYAMKSLVDYIQMLRMEKSKELLRDSELPVNEIVGNIGYLDTSNFIRKFRISEGVTPGEYRKRFRCIKADCTARV